MTPPDARKQKKGAVKPAPAPNVQLSLAAAALSNAEELQKDARHLLRNGRIPRAASLAVVGVEEAGKALLLFFMAMGYTPDENVPHLFARLRWDHKTKQAMGLVPQMLGVFLARIAPAVRGLVRKVPRHPAHVTDLASFWKAVETGVEGMLPLLGPILEQHSKDLPPIEQDIEAATGGKWQVLRNRGLYVDVDGDRPILPSDVTKAEAQEALRTLTDTLRGLRHFKKIAKLSGESLHEMRRLLPLADRLSPAELMTQFQPLPDTPAQDHGVEKLKGRNQAKRKSRGSRAS